MNASKLVIGVLGGVAVGTIAGILLAPNKGSKTRKKMMSKGKGFSKKLKGKFEDLYENTNDKYDTLLQDAKELVPNKGVKVKK